MRWRPRAVPALLVLTVAVAPRVGAEEPVLPDARADLDPEVVALIERSAAAVRADPGSVEAWSRLCMAFEANLLWPETGECYEALLGVDSGVDPRSTAVRRFHLATARLETGSLDGARAELEAAISLDPALAPAWERLGYLLLEQGEVEQALSRFEHLIEALPGSPAGFLGAGEVELLLGRSEQAARHLERALELDPTASAAHYQLGLAYRALGRSGEAERELALGLGGERRLLPSPMAEQVAGYSVHLAAQIERAGVLLQEGRDEEASQVLEALMERAPDNVTVLNDLSVAYLRLGRLDEARSLLDRALAIDDRDFSTYLNLSAWAGYAGKPLEATGFARTAVEVAPAVAATHLALARALGDRRYLGVSQQPMADRGEMLDEMRRAIEIGVDTPDVYLQLARELWREGRVDTAFEALDEALSRWPDFWPADLMRAWILVRDGRSAEATEAIERVRAQMPDHPDLATLERMIDEAGSGGEG
jgi:tetratricopeptide (TPR) repeat protein